MKKIYLFCHVLRHTKFSIFEGNILGIKVKGRSRLRSL